MVWFARFDYRTREIAAARAFYEALLGPNTLNFVPLPEAARGAPSHWLGYLAVDDVERIATSFVEHGAVRLTPPHAEDAVLRDRGGALVGLTRASASLTDAVVWWHLDCRDVARACAAYAALFGWTVRPSPDEAQFPGLMEFALRPGEASVGTMRDAGTAVHPQWIFHFHAETFDGAVAAVRALGGVVIDVLTLADQRRIAICDDALGAGFALRAGVRPSR